MTATIGQNKPLKTKTRRTKVSRRQFLALLTGGGGAAALAMAGLPAQATLASTLPTASPEEPPVCEGYSIFHETMVAMTWPEIKQAAQQGAIVLLPIAVIEEHGPHMGLAPDVYQTYLWSKLTRRVLEEKGIQTLIAPPYYWGICQDTGSFPGSFTVRAETFKAALYDLHDCLQRWGFKSVFSLNLHGDPMHNDVLVAAIREVRDGLGMDAYVVPQRPPSLPGEFQLKQPDVHAGAIETAFIAAYFPQEVRVELAKTLKPSTGFAPLGYFGDPANFELFKVEDIKKWHEDFAANTATWIETILKINE